ncbi:DUF4386 domain-containing protein [Embleya sp. NPDC005575]|uniref:DUF4386 domain-containing protein n=1 Tax=Embleya sp. NPDC005575 TaxID=3156892 RepID=UPI0033B780CC
MNPTRGTAIVAGVFFLVTEVAAIVGVLLYRPVLADSRYILGAGADGRVLAGALCEIVLAIAIIGSAVTLYPVLRRRHEGAALGYVCLRLLEAAVIVVGIVGTVSIVTLRQEGVGAADADAAVLVGKALLAIHDCTFLFGPNFILGANTVVLAALAYTSRLVPRTIAVCGLIGGPLICASATAVLFGLYAQVSVVGSIAAVPVFGWEVALAVRLIAKGFDPSPAEARRRCPDAGGRAVSESV